MHIIEKILEIIFSVLIEKILGRIYPLIKHGFSRKKHPKIDDLKYLKLRLINIFARLGQFPEYSIVNPNQNKTLIDSFYKTMIKLISELFLDDKYFDYFKTNLTRISVENKEQLIGCLKKEMENPQRNDSKFLLGFRSIHFILRENIDKINVSYIDSIYDSLNPFVDNHKRKEYLLVYN